MKPPRDIDFIYSDEDISILKKYGLDPDKYHDIIERLSNIQNKNVRDVLTNEVTYDRYDTALQILKEIADAIKNKNKIKVVYLEYLAECIDRVVESGEDPETAFNLKKPNHAPPKPKLKTLRSEIFLYYEIKKLIESGKKRSVAIDFVAIEKNIGIKKLEKIYYKYNKKYNRSS